MEAVHVTAIAISSTSAPVASAIPVSKEVPATTSEKTSVVPTAHPKDEVRKLIKAMQDMSIQTTEINRLKEQVKNLEDEKKLAQVIYKAKSQKANRLTERIHKLEK